MSFFDDIPEEESFAIDSTRAPDWSGPPANMVGGTAALDLVLVNTGDAAVVLRGVTAFPIGFPNGRTAEGIEETVVAIDSAPIRDAALRAIELWPDERPVE